MAKKKKKFSDSVRYSLRGIVHGVSSERNVKIQVLIGVVVIFLAAYLGIPKLEFILIIFAVFLVIILELVNTTLERLIDKIHPKYDKDYEKIKDLMAGVVFLGVLLAILVGFLILFEPLVSLLS